MYIESREERARSAARRWKQTYGNRQEPLALGETPMEIHRRLVVLGPNPSPDDVDTVVGNTSWTTAACDICYEVAGDVVVTCVPDHADWSPKRICLSCVGELHATICAARARSDLRLESHNTGRGFEV